MNNFSTPMDLVLTIVLVVLMILVLCCLIYAIRSRRFTDKIVAANMIGSLGMNIVVIFAIYLGQSYMLDIGIVIASLSFLAVIVLCRVVSDHIFGQMRHMQNGKDGALTKESLSHAGTEDHLVTNASDSATTAKQEDLA